MTPKLFLHLQNRFLDNHGKDLQNFLYKYQEQQHQANKKKVN
jgi:hypothetical protein